MWSRVRQDGIQAPTESGDKESLMIELWERGLSSQDGARPGESGKETGGKPVGLTSADWPQWSVVSEGSEGVKKTLGVSLAQTYLMYNFG